MSARGSSSLHTVWFHTLWQFVCCFSHVSFWKMFRKAIQIIVYSLKGVNAIKTLGTKLLGHSFCADGEAPSKPPGRGSPPLQVFSKVVNPLLIMWVIAWTEVWKPFWIVMTVWEGSKGGFPCPLWTTIVKQRCWFTSSLISHLQCSVVFPSLEFQVKHTW